MADFKFYNVELGTRFFVHYNGALRECKLIGYDFSLRNVFTEVYVYMGKNAPCVPLKCDDELYRSIEDALVPNASSRKSESMCFFSGKAFSRRFLKEKGVNYNPIGSHIYGWLWDGSKAEIYAPSETINKIRVRFVNGKMVTTLLGYNDKEVVLTKKWYQSAEECSKNNKPNIVMLDDEEECSEECIINITIKCDSKDKANVLDKIDSIKLNYSIK